jgi:hypothetical protein
VEQVVEITLSADENAAFMMSVDAVRTGCAKFM